MPLYKNDKALIDDCVAAFLACADSALSQARQGAAGFDGLSASAARDNARRAWSGISRARLFCVHPERWVHAYNVADHYVTGLADPDRGHEYHPARQRARTGAEYNVSMNLTRIWGLTPKEAIERGYIGDPPPGEEFPVDEAPRHYVTAAGIAALRTKLDGMPKADRIRLWEAMDRVEEAQKIGDVRTVGRAIEVIEQITHSEVDADAERFFQACEEYGPTWPFPDPMPFDAIFLSYGKKLNLTASPAALHARVRRDQWEGFGEPDVFLLGHLLSWEGDDPTVYSFLQFGAGEGTGILGIPDQSAVGIVATYDHGEWAQPLSLDPWILDRLVRTINEHKQIVEDYRPTLGHKMDRKRASKRAKQTLPLPTPFYMVHLRDELIAPPRKKPTRLTGRPVEWSHRWDVRGHECVRIVRGELPAPPDEIAKLKRRGYRIYEGMALTGDDASRLLKRGVRAPGPREWIAILSYWREAMIKGPQDKPYVPAARVGV